MKTYTLITGGTKGIGYELAKLFARDNHNLILVSRNEDELKLIKKELENNYKVEVIITAVDLSVENSYKKLINLVETKMLVVDNLINNAGIGSFGLFEEIDIKKDNNLLFINIITLTNLTKYFLEKMKKLNYGGILNVASTAAFIGGAKMSTYYASKAYVLNLTEAIHEECRENNIKISCLCPGPVNTGFQNRAGIIKSEKAKKYLISSEFVAKEAYRGFNKGKDIIIPGFKNKVMITFTKIMPRKVVRKIIANTNK